MNTPSSIYQKVFNKVIAGLRFQNWEKSVNEYNTLCMYSGVDNCRCPIGHLMSDEALKKFGSVSMRVNELNKHYCWAPSEFHIPTLENIRFLICIQEAHDVAKTANAMMENYKSIAKNFGLNFTEALLVGNFSQ